MSEDKFGDDDPQTAAFLLSASQINMEQIKGILDDRYAPAEAHVEQALRIDELSKEYKRLNRLQWLWWAAWTIGIVIWLFLK